MAFGRFSPLVLAFACLLPLPLFAQERTTLRLEILTTDVSDCDAFARAGHDVSCLVLPALAVRNPVAATLNCATLQEGPVLARLLNAQNAWYAFGRAEDAAACDTADISLAFAHVQDATGQAPARSVGILPQPLGDPPEAAVGALAVSSPPTNLSPFSIRLSFGSNNAAAAVLCETLTERWPRLRCDGNASNSRNALMISCPGVPATTSQLIANLFQTAFEVYEWRDDPLACDQAYGIDIELTSLTALPNLTAIELALNQPIITILTTDQGKVISQSVADLQDEGSRANAALPLAAAPPEADEAPAQPPGEAQTDAPQPSLAPERTAARDLTAALAPYQGIAIVLQFPDTPDWAACNQLTDLGLNITCRTNVSESSSNIMLRCPRLSPAAARAFGDFLSLRDPRLWDWRARPEALDANDCTAFAGLELEIWQPIRLDTAALTMKETPAVNTLSQPNSAPWAWTQPALQPNHPALSQAGAAGLRIEVGARNRDSEAQVCAYFTSLGFDVVCGIGLTETRSNIALLCADVSVNLREEIEAVLRLDAGDLALYDWRERPGIGQPTCDVATAFTLEIY